MSALVEIMVALHAESVDRNQVVGQTHTHQKVALHAESVDRNELDQVAEQAAIGRSPCGERG